MKIPAGFRTTFPRVPIAWLLALGTPLAAQGTGPKEHRLPATPRTVAYGYYWAEAKPVLTIASGDVIDVETMITNNPTRLEQAGVPPNEIQQSLRDIVAQVTDRGPGGHILTGPVFVQGAEPGDVLEVKVLSVDLAIPYGYNGCSGFIRELCDRSQPTTRIIRLDAARMIGQFAPGIDVPLKPFFGSMGVAPPPSRGRVSSNPPDIHAGNLDNKELVAGTTLYIPVHVPGALFEVGDGHAAQGDGEVDQTAIETSLRGRLQLTVRKDLKLEWPRGETPTHWITMGMDTSLTKSTRIAVEQMVKLIMEKKGLSQTAAYQLASIVADLRITQLVDGNVGVHMMIAKGFLRN
jgi:acetamidase/formamidase